MIFYFLTAIILTNVPHIYSQTLTYTYKTPKTLTMNSNKDTVASGCDCAECLKTSAIKANMATTETNKFRERRQRTILTKRLKPCITGTIIKQVSRPMDNDEWQKARDTLKSVTGDTEEELRAKFIDDDTYGPAIKALQKEETEVWRLQRLVDAAELRRKRAEKRLLSINKDVDDFRMMVDLNLEEVSIDDDIESQVSDSQESDSQESPKKQKQLHYLLFCLSSILFSNKSNHIKIFNL